MLLASEPSYDYTTACRWKMTDKEDKCHLPSTGCRVVVAGQMQATFVPLIRHLPSTGCCVVVAGQIQATFVPLIRHLPCTGCRVVVAGQMQPTFVHLTCIWNMTDKVDKCCLHLTSYDYTTACRWKMTDKVDKCCLHLTSYDYTTACRWKMTDKVRCKQHLSTLSVIFHLQAVV
jgi:hypothetical protein